MQVSGGWLLVEGKNKREQDLESFDTSAAIALEELDRYTGRTSEQSAKRERLLTTLKQRALENYDAAIETYVGTGASAMGNLQSQTAKEKIEKSPTLQAIAAGLPKLAVYLASTITDYQREKARLIDILETLLRSFSKDSYNPLVAFMAVAKYKNLDKDRILAYFIVAGNFRGFPASLTSSVSNAIDISFDEGKAVRIDEDDDDSDEGSSQVSKRTRTKQEDESEPAEPAPPATSGVVVVNDGNVLSTNGDAYLYIIQAPSAVRAALLANLVLRLVEMAKKPSLRAVIPTSQVQEFQSFISDILDVTVFGNFSETETLLQISAKKPVGKL
jgi:hypothetical protein